MTSRSVTAPTEARHTAPWWHHAVSLAAVIASLWAIVRLTARALERQAVWSDYAIFHATVNRWLDGLPMYGTGIRWLRTNATEGVNFNPPQFHLLVLPFARLELWPGLLLWQVANILAGCVCAAIVIRTLRPGWSMMPATLTIAVLINSAALSSTLWLGQMSLFLAVPVTLAWRAWHLNRPMSTAGWMGLAASIKPLLLIVFPYLLLKRHWRAAVWGGATWALSFATGVLVFGLAALTQWLGAAQWPTWAAHFQNASFHAYVGRVMLEWPDAIVARAGSTVGIAATIWVASKRDHDTAWALLMTGALLWAPLGWVYYEWFVVPPLAALIVHRQLPRIAWLLTIAFLWPINVYALRITGTFLDVEMVRSIYFWGLLGLWLLLCSSALAVPRTSSADAHATVVPALPA